MISFFAREGNSYIISSHVYLLSGPPGEPAGVKASSPGKHDAQLQWTAGAANGARITSFIIEKYNTDTQKWVVAKNGKL